MKSLLFTISFLISINLIYALEPVTVAQLTIDIGAKKSEEMFYGFAEGDVIIFSFEEINGRKVRSIEITELPNNIRFSDMNQASTREFKINVTNESVYKFEFSNSSLRKRICRVTIKRIPSTEELVNFNTDWKWENVYDTIFTPFVEDSLVGYDTIMKPFTKNELVRIDTTFHEIKSNETQTRIRSRTHTSCFGNAASCTKNKTMLSYPENTEFLLVWIGVGQNAKSQFDDLTKQFSKTIINSGLTYLSGGAGLLASSFVNNTIDSFLDNIKPSKSVIDIFFTDKKNADFWYNDMNNRINTFKGLSFKNKAIFKHTINKKDLPKENMYLCIKNNATRNGVDVTMSVVAVTLEEVYEEKNYTKQDIKPKYVKVNKTKMKINKTRIRVNSN